MIAKVFKYLATPGFFHKSPTEVNPIGAWTDLLQRHKKDKESLRSAREEEEGVKFENVTLKRAKGLYKAEVERLNISTTQQRARYHQHVVRGTLMLLFGLALVSLPIIGLFRDFGIRVPLVSLFLPTFSYPVLITMVPTSGVLLLIMFWHYYMAKMIMLKQRFPFMLYIRSGRWLPTRSEVLK